ncbi:MAG: rod shape-determining protein RodA [Candidatus Jidaibacter sp.]|jgi:rod shape determining protein RodA|nr:rod shape-determining protein RodA [Candidatus Jidaibacter sp.]
MFSKSDDSRINFLKEMDYVLLAQILAMCISSVAMLYSAALGSIDPWAFKQAITLCIFAPIIFLIASLEFKTVYTYAYVVYGIAFFFLVLAAIFGHKAMGAQRWLRVGVINFQPSELMKIGLILALARYYHDLHTNEIGKIRSLLPPLLLSILPALLVLKQPNLGTASILIVIAAVILFASGVKLWKFAFVGISAILLMPAVWYMLHDYQRQRVLTFLNPEADPLGSGYNIIQSIIAIGSGGFFGKGFIEGTQSQLNFLPEKQTDFILSVIAEEFGFFGVATMLVLTLGIIFSCYKKAFTANNQFFRLIAIGVATSFAFHAIINAGMIAGLLPVVGMPYPLLSYGGSSLAAFLIGFGLVLNTKLRNQSS